MNEQDESEYDGQRVRLHKTKKPSQIKSTHPKSDRQIRKNL